MPKLFSLLEKTRRELFLPSNEFFLRNFFFSLRDSVGERLNDTELIFIIPQERESGSETGDERNHLA